MLTTKYRYFTEHIQYQHHSPSGGKITASKQTNHSEIDDMAHVISECRKKVKFSMETLIGAAERNMPLLCRVHSLRQYPAKRHQQLTATMKTICGAANFENVADAKYVAKCDKILKAP